MPRLPERSCASRGPGPIKRALFGFAISSPCARALRGSSRFSSIPFRTRRKAILPRTIHCDPYRQQPHRNAMARGASGVHADAERSFEGRQGAHRSNSVSAAGSLGLFGWLYRSSSENCGGSVNRHGPASSAWVGFTVSTGWGCQNHDILTWSFVGADTSSSMSVVFSDISFPMSACLPDRNLCTPEHAFVQYNGAGYHIVLPANFGMGCQYPELVGASGGGDRSARRRLLGSQSARLGRVQWALQEWSTRGRRISSGRRAGRGVDYGAPRRAYLVLGERP